MADQKNSENPDPVIIIEEKNSKANGETVVRKYVRGKLLGRGGFAKCYEITNIETKKTQAAKIIPKSTLSKNRARQKLISEIKIHKSLHHANVVDFEHVFEDHENVYILLEICQNQTLNELLKRRKRLTELEVQCYLNQIINSLKYLVSNRVIHRDLKLGNLFLNDKMEVKLGDFGLATKLEFDGEKKKTICGTPNYIAPEILEGKAGHSYEVDIWSLGVIIYTLVIGKPPFETPDVKTTYKKIRMNSYSFPEHIPISDPVRNLITRILNLDPTKRPNLDDIMQHPFLNIGTGIPKTMPLSTLACPPSANYIKQFQSMSGTRTSINVDKMQTTNSRSNFGLGIDMYVDNQSDFRKSGQLDPMVQSTKTLNNFQLGSMSQNRKNSVQQKCEVFVKKWIDYSSKYGLGYLLSNGSTGVFFNDSTKIVAHPKYTYFEYMERKYNDRQDVISQHTFTDYPKDLQKKVTLLQHFKNYLEADKEQDISDQEDYKDKPLIYLKKWMKTRHAILFRLSNKIVQVNFTDKTEVILSSELKMLTYVNKKQERSHYPLATALESTNTEMTKRLKYTKEILAHMLNNPQGDKNHNIQTETN